MLVGGYLVQILTSKAVLITFNAENRIRQVFLSLFVKLLLISTAFVIVKISFGLKIVFYLYFKINLFQLKLILM